MSGDYDNTNSGALFKNDKEGGNPKWPDYRGSVNVDGVDYWLDAWIRKSKKGTTFMSLRVKPKQQNGERRMRDETGPTDAATRDFDDNIPF